MKYLSYSVADHLSLHPPPHHQYHQWLQFNSCPSISRGISSPGTHAPSSHSDGNCNFPSPCRHLSPTPSALLYHYHHRRISIQECPAFVPPDTSMQSSTRAALTATVTHWNEANFCSLESLTTCSPFGPFVT